MEFGFKPSSFSADKLHKICFIQFSLALWIVSDPHMDCHTPHCSCHFVSTIILSVVDEINCRITIICPFLGQTYFSRTADSGKMFCQPIFKNWLKVTCDALAFDAFEDRWELATLEWHYARPPAACSVLAMARLQWWVSARTPYQNADKLKPFPWLHCHMILPYVAWNFCDEILSFCSLVIPDHYRLLCGIEAPERLEF